MSLTSTECQQRAQPAVKQQPPRIGEGGPNGLADVMWVKPPAVRKTGKRDESNATKGNLPADYYYG